ncbi:GNAT family N-acetyltransferase [Arthrobacter sp. MYb224]|uniref:GNAT family N-acetyltransferase n=1 Tax=unclassified Arthrobacter TaxID=235627 RepID=UPI000CFB139F|nr:MULTISPECIES: GNAT family N-acetyltransferase [unclassified Arthrobacter]PRA00307.1 GNAT family N-acetyltransferase [Arthrobacter sp. MYb224]PRA04498.1 GNAT family N-acetyltransferase [Arthrobacter sp. MYb229]PRB51589.1 GNAT family N-acetyltransferase [Arthrobacter sp. MYb216]
MEANAQSPAADKANWEVLPLTADRFADFASVVNPGGREKHCWCLSHRLGAKEIKLLGAGDRAAAMRALSAEPIAPGVVAYRDSVPVGWCSISPRSQIPLLERSKLIRPVDDLKVWSIICVVVRSGYRRQGVSTEMLTGALRYAQALGAPAVEAYPVDPEGRMDLTMAFVGTRKMFERVGFELIGSTDAVASRMPRLIMRKDLTAH